MNQDTFLPKDTKLDQVHFIADIGGTNARFAVATAGRYFEMQVLNTRAYSTFAQALDAYLHSIQHLKLQFRNAQLAVAAPINTTLIQFTNNAWTINPAATATQLNCEVEIINDFAAQAMALAIPDLKLLSIHRPDNAVDHHTSGTKLILGPGTGLGVAYAQNGQIYTTEAGHITLASRTPIEFEIYQFIMKRYGHVSAERVCSGAGLEILYEFLSGEQKKAVSIYSRGQHSPQSLEAKAVQQFMAYFGHITSQLAMSVNANAGIYLSGGVSAKIADAFPTSNFYDNFSARGRFSNYVSQMPIWLIREPQPALAGLAYQSLTHS